MVDHDVAELAVLKALVAAVVDRARLLDERVAAIVAAQDVDVSGRDVLVAEQRGVAAVRRDPLTVVDGNSLDHRHLTPGLAVIDGGGDVDRREVEARGVHAIAVRRGVAHRRDRDVDVTAGRTEMAESVGLAVIGQPACRRGPGAAGLRPAPELTSAAETVLRRDPDQSRAADVDRRLARGVGPASGRARRLRLQLTDRERRRRWPRWVVRVAMVTARGRPRRQRSGNRETRRTRGGGGQGGKAHRRTSSSEGRRPRVRAGRPTTGDVPGAPNRSNRTNATDAEAQAPYSA